jgi:hypothetical protein
MSEDFDSELGSAELELGDRLEQHRPVPGAGFRGSLARHLSDRDPGFGPRPANLLGMAGASLGGGLLLIGLAALSATGTL